MAEPEPNLLAPGELVDFQLVSELRQQEQAPPADLVIGGFLVGSPSMDPAVVRRTLGRSYYDDAAEREAEVTATVLVQMLALETDTTPAVTSALEHRRTGV